MTALNVAAYQALRSLGSTWWTLSAVAGRLRHYGHDVTDRQVARAMGRLVEQGLVVRDKNGTVRYRYAR